MSLLHHSALNSSAFQWFGFSSSASPQPNEKETAQSGNEQGNKEPNEATSQAPHETEQSISDGKTELGSAGYLTLIYLGLLKREEVLNKLHFLILIQIWRVTFQQMIW